jgi:hypothetical protein
VEPGGENRIDFGHRLVERCAVDAMRAELGDD